MGWRPSGGWTIHLKLLLVAVTWGLGWTAGRVMALELEPFTAAWIRYIIAVPLLIGWMVWVQGWRPPSRGEWKMIIVIGLFSTFLYQSLFMSGMRWTASGDASLVITFNPLFTALLAIPFLGSPLTKRLTGGLLLGVMGITLIFIDSPNIDLPSDERMLGDAFITAAALSWAISSIMMKKAMSNPAEDSDAPMTPLELTVWASIVGLLMLTPWAGWETYAAGGLPSIDWRVWTAILFLAIGSTVISYVWFADGIRDIGASHASLYVFLVPPFGILSGWLLLSEQLGWSLFAAFVLIVGGVTLGQSESTAAEDGSTDEAVMPSDTRHSR